MLHLYTGDGKGKTSAAIGLCVRARGAGLRVLFAQFLKGMETSELIPLEQLGVVVVREAPSHKFLFQMDEAEQDAYRTAQHESFRALCERAGDFDLMVLDEALDAVSCGIIPEAELLAFIDDRPAGLELVLTGRGPSPALRERADYHSDLHAVRHPYQQGVTARRGIEY